MERPLTCKCDEEWEFNPVCDCFEPDSFVETYCVKCEHDEECHNKGGLA